MLAAKPTTGVGRSTRIRGLEGVVRHSISVSNPTRTSAHSIHHTASLYGGTRYCDRLSSVSISQARTTALRWWHYSGSSIWTSENSILLGTWANKPRILPLRKASDTASGI
jgi:hypothetical protein